MNRCFAKFFYLVVIVCWIVIAINLPHRFYFVRESNENNTGNVTDEWPWKMEIGLANYFCDTPMLNLEINDSEVIAAWNLPPESRLSSIMLDVGRCEMAANKIRSMGIEFDSRHCRCVKFWPIWVYAIAGMCIGASSFSIVLEFLHDYSDFPGTEWDCLIFNNMVSEIIVGFAVVLVWNVIGTSGADIGFVYTIYGDVYPTPYYISSLTDLHVVAWCLLITFFMLICAVISTIIEIIDWWIYSRDDAVAEHIRIQIWPRKIVLVPYRKKIRSTP